MIAESPQCLDNFAGGIGREIKKNAFNPRVANERPSSLTSLFMFKFVKESV